MTLCTFCTIEPGLHRCTVCGRLARHRNTNIHAECRGPQPMGLGDMIASGLAYVGITNERVAALVGDCGCQQRQEALNEFGRSIGIGGCPDDQKKA
jgi:hypothetical protein